MLLLAGLGRLRLAHELSGVLIDGDELLARDGAGLVLIHESKESGRGGVGAERIDLLAQSDLARREDDTRVVSNHEKRPS
jgi:hypothetical protein